MVSISSLPEFGPDAKNTAGSPGKTRISRNVRTSTPNSAGSDDAKRMIARLAVETSNIMSDTRNRFSCKCETPHGAPLRRHSGSHSFPAEVPIVDLTMELIGVTRKVRRHHRILARLPQ